MKKLAPIFIIAGIACFLFVLPKPTVFAQEGVGSWSMAGDWYSDLLSGSNEDPDFHHTTYQSAYIWQNDDGADVNSNTNMTLLQDTTVTGIHPRQRLTARIQLYTTTLADNAGYILQYKKTGDSVWRNVSGGAPIAPSVGLAGSYGDSLTTNECDAPSEKTWQNGEWYEGWHQSNSIASFPKDNYTELAFAVKTTTEAEAGATYELRLRDVSDSGKPEQYDVYPALTIASGNR